MASIANAENVIFDNLVTVTNSNIIYDDATGVFIVGVAGTYYISWWANIDGAEEGTSLLFSIVTSEGQVISACSMVPVTSLQLNGNALVNFAAPGSFSLKNFSGNTANYGEAVVQASLVIIEVAN
ncbi:MAG: hypothetical protein PHE93_04170 [Clostridia bacterium]|nr:hypothetical protein [Clostridia bacterium]